MRISTKRMRESVTQWLRDEKATINQALELQSALEAGAIDGNNYAGARRGGSEEIDALYGWQSSHPRNRPDVETFESDEPCGCLLETLEQIKNHRPVRLITGKSAEAYAFATFIELGDTPKNSRWAKAAVDGIEDYLSTL